MISKIKKPKRNPKVVRESLGGFIKKMRLQKGYSQSELATHLGYMSPQFISDWERGISSPPVKKLSELADLLGVKADIIFDLLLTLATEQLVENLSNEFKLAKRSS